MNTQKTILDIDMDTLIAMSLTAAKIITNKRGNPQEMRQTAFKLTDAALAEEQKARLTGHPNPNTIIKGMIRIIASNPPESNSVTISTQQTPKTKRGNKNERI